ncbi:MAG: hypothetical protein ACK4K0_08030 [Flavobacteriales bacterium]
MSLKSLYQKIVPQSLQKGIELKLHRGDVFECPFCGYKSKDLKPVGIDVPVIRKLKIVGAGKRKGGCYNCGAHDREKLVYLYLKH